MTHRVTRLTSKISALAFASILLTGVACKDLTSYPASLATFTDSGTVWALNGAPTGFPSALYTYSGYLVPADASFAFDLAFDLDQNGNILILPQRAIATGLVTTHQVALATVTDDFASVTSVPKGLQFRADTAMTVQKGQVVIAQVSDSDICLYSLTGSTLFAKLMITDTDPATRTMKVTYTVDPNCGFRSFASGVPED